MDKMYEIIRYLFILGIFFLLIELIGLIRSIKIYFKEKLPLESYKIDLTTPIDESDYSLLDNIVNTALSDYVIDNGIVGNDYISENEENIICNNICKNITNNMSEFTILKLSKIYNLDKLSDIIASKVYLAVGIYSAEINSSIKK